MNELGYNKQKQINYIVSVLKLISLFCSIIIFLKIYLKTNENSYDFNYVYTLILFLIYVTWSISTIKKIRSVKSKNIIRTIENIVFIFIFSVIIIMSGAYESQYKLLFLFIILTSTIQSGMKQGLAIACISSTIILTMDMVYLPGVLVNHYFENDLLLSCIFYLTAWPLGFYVKIENEHISKLESMVNIDRLTEVFNHRYFHDALKQKILQYKKDKKPISLIFLDIDYFKCYNDLYGYQKGDEVLKTIGGILNNNARTGDIVSRYGGEEFAIILADTEEKDAFVVAERIRQNIEQTYFDGEENQPNGNLTVSIGISVYPSKAKNDFELINSAGDALYRAKFFNKNRVETYTSVLDELKNDIEEKHIDLVTSIKTLISVINAKDKYTYSHVERVVIYCKLLAEKLGLSDEDKKNLIYGAYMHDIGKINISKEILIKKMPLTDDEWSMLKQHPLNGAEIIKPVESLKDISPLIMHHHERFDGGGYPDNLKGAEIPYLARVLTVVDSFDAMTSTRSYTNIRKTYDEALFELNACMGTQFDPFITEKFIEVIESNKELQNE